MNNFRNKSTMVDPEPPPAVAQPTEVTSNKPGDAESAKQVKQKSNTNQCRRDSGSVRMGSGQNSLLERGEWDHKAEFVLSCIGFSVGLGNVWRFPFLAFQNGGAAFLFAYIILQILVGKPLYFMELCMGQFSGKGPTKIWEMNPAAKGIGLSMCLISTTTAVYYNIIIAYTIHYFFATLQERLPWAYCKEEWKILNCVADRSAAFPPCTALSTHNCTCSGDNKIDKALSFTCIPMGVTAAELYFYKDVLQISDGVDWDQVGAPLWQLTLCLAAAWAIVALCLSKGIKSSGKVVYFSATFPYVILFVLLIRGSTLEGASEGVRFFLVPVWSKLLDLHVWVAALGQMFFSLSVSFGGILMFGSYNKFTNRVTWDALCISMMDMITSVIAGLVVFTTFGAMAKKLGTDVENVARAGYGLAFIAYPEALTYLPPTRLWSLLFFVMLFLLGLDSEFALLETSLTCLQDEFPWVRKHKLRLSIGVAAMCFFLSLPCATPGGDYIVTIMDHFGGDFSVLFTALFEVISIMWVYGVSRFLKDLEYMIGYKPRAWQYWAICLTIVAPVTISSLILYRIINYKSLKYSNGVPYPVHAQLAGWLLLFGILIPVPAFFFRRLYKSLALPKNERFNFMFKPTAAWVPNNNSAYLLPGSHYHAKEENVISLQEAPKIEHAEEEHKLTTS